MDRGETQLITISTWNLEADVSTVQNNSHSIKNSNKVIILTMKSDKSTNPLIKIH